VEDLAAVQLVAEVGVVPGHLLVVGVGLRQEDEDAEEDRGDASRQTHVGGVDPGTSDRHGDNLPQVEALRGAVRKSGAQSGAMCV
jgi:hypothetical protein